MKIILSLALFLSMAQSAFGNDKTSRAQELSPRKYQVWSTTKAKVGADGRYEANASCHHGLKDTGIAEPKGRNVIGGSCGAKPDKHGKLVLVGFQANALDNIFMCTFQRVGPGANEPAEIWVQALCEQ